MHMLVRCWSRVYYSNSGMIKGMAIRSWLPAALFASLLMCPRLQLRLHIKSAALCLLQPRASGFQISRQTLGLLMQPTTYSLQLLEDTDQANI